jgi:hypothetical protein
MLLSPNRQGAAQGDIEISKRTAAPPEVLKHSAVCLWWLGQHRAVKAAQAFEAPPGHAGLVQGFWVRVA